MRLTAFIAKVEDALCLTTLMSQVVRADTAINTTGSCSELRFALETAFQAFDTVRRKRTQWLVNSSRRVCDLYHQAEWGDPKRWAKADTCFEEIRDRSYKIWNFDADYMIRQSVAEYELGLCKATSVNVLKDVSNVIDEKSGYVL